jgi:hypothetical protein
MNTRVTSLYPVSGGQAGRSSARTAAIIAASSAS